MSAVLTIRDAIRDFLRKYDEITTPIIRFLIALVVFNSVNKMYGYSGLFERGMVKFLLAVIAALVTDTVVVLIVGAVMCVNTFAVSVEVGALFLLMFILMYSLYMRMFYECSWILILVPVLYTMDLQYAAPLIIAIFIGLTGAVPAGFGVVLYYFSICVKDVHGKLEAISNLAASAASTGSKVDDDFNALTYIVKTISGNKEMILAAIVFAIVIIITHTIHSLSFDYSWYVAIGVGAVCNIICFAICGSMLGVSAGSGSVVMGTIIGTLVALVIQVCKSIADYSRKEMVQFEDDEYYYYVKAIPKLGMPAKNKNVKTLTDKEEKVAKQVKGAAQSERRSSSARSSTARAAATETAKRQSASSRATGYSSRGTANRTNPSGRTGAKRPGGNGQGEE